MVCSVPQINGTMEQYGENITEAHTQNKLWEM